VEKLKQYRIQSDNDFSAELDTFEKAIETFESWKDDYMSDAVVAGETFVEIVESEDAFDDYKVIKKVIAVIDNNRHELGTPREEGFDWDYWAKWEEVVA
jgi:hypothetical protein